MTIRYRHYKVDDLEALENPGGPEVEADRTVRISVDDHEVEIDLSAANRKTLLDELEPYFRAGRRVRGPGRRRPQKDRNRSARVRAWARENGIKVEDRGRIPADVEERYKTQAGSA